MTEESPSRVPTGSDVISALGRTGFLLEYQVAQVLRGHGFSTYLNYPYPDPETGKSREIDVSADKETHIHRQPVEVYVQIELIVECKNTPNPFVIIGERGRPFSGSSESFKVTFDPLRLRFPGPPYETIWSTLKLGSLPGMLTMEDFIGRQLVRMNQHSGNWRADNEGVYESILQPLAKARAHLRSLNDEDVDPKPWECPYITFYLPILVTSGPVLTVTVTNQGHVVDQVGYAAFQRAFHTDAGFKSLIMDVVSYEHLDTYLKTRVVRIFESAETAIRSNIHLYDPEWLLANRGEPKNVDLFNSWLESIRKSRDSARGTGSKNT